MSDKNLQTHNNQHKETEGGERHNTDASVKSTINLMKCIDNNQVEELNYILSHEGTSRMTLNTGLQKAVQSHRNNGEMLGIIKSLLRYHSK